MISKRGGSSEPQLAVLPFCGVCGKVKGLFVHDIDFENAPNYDYHEFEPCVTLAEAEEAIEELELELARVREKVRENVRD